MSDKLTPAEKAALTYVFTPSQSNAAYQELNRKLYGSTGIETGSPALDTAIIPTRQSMVRLWVALPGHGKSTMLRSIARRYANKLRSLGLDDEYYVAALTYEEGVEMYELGIQERSFSNEAFWRGEVPQETVMRDSANRPSLPLYVFGDSMARSRVSSPPMTLDVVLNGMTALKKLHGLKPALICVDFIQEVEVAGGGGRTERTAEAMYRLLRLGTQTSCAIELAAQASYEAYNNSGLPLPTAGQVAESKVVYQRATSVVGICRPYAWKPNESEVKINGIMFPNHPHLTVARIPKHRPGSPHEDIPFLMNPDTLEVGDWNMQGKAQPAEEIPF